jgi:MbtH protein
LGRYLEVLVFDDDEQAYWVVVNDEEQYSIWPAERELPPGWRATGSSGSKESCLAYVDEVWVDMRPRSLRLQMAGSGESDGAD